MSSKYPKGELEDFPTHICVFFICFALFAYLFLNRSSLLHTFAFEEFLLVATENKSLELIADIGRVARHSCVYLI